MLPSASMTTSASSGLTTQGEQSISVLVNFSHRVSKCWMKTSDQGRRITTRGSISGQKVCGAPGDSESKHECPLGVLPEEPESLPTSGSLSSPNFPSNYPNDLHERKTIKVAKGNVIKIHFTDFEVERVPNEADIDFLDITDGDGTFLGHFGAKHYVTYKKDLSWIRIGDLTSVTETVHVLFHTDESGTERGWRLDWSSK